MTSITDLRSTILPKLDQLNSEQLMAGPMILTVTEVRAGGSEEQPVSVYYAADPARPFKPCKTMRRVLILAWGADGNEWVGKSMELYCDDSVKFGGEAVGGIRISRLSGITKQIEARLTATRGKKSLYQIRPLAMSPELTKVLEAITAATGNDTMKKARALAEATLTADADLALALAAYNKKLRELKAKAAAPATPAIAPADDPSAGAETVEMTEDQVRSNIEGAADRDILDLARGQIESVKDAQARYRLEQAVSKREDELNA